MLLKKVLEGSLISSMVFDQINYATLAYADGIAVICETANNLIQIIKPIEKKVAFCS